MGWSNGQVTEDQDFPSTVFLQVEFEVIMGHPSIQAYSIYWFS